MQRRHVERRGKKRKRTSPNKDRNMEANNPKNPSSLKISM